MAIFSTIIIATTLLTSFALSAPVHTVTETDWVTLDVTTTIYIDDAMSKTFTPVPVTTTFDATTSALAVETTPMATSTAPVSTLATVVSSPSVTPTAIPASFYTPAVTPAAMTTSSTTTSAEPASNSASLEKSTTGPSSASDSATCEGESNACQGDITYYSAGLGACGVTNADTDFIIALPVGLMGSQSNGNPYCGRSLTIFNPTTGNSVQATVEDKCMGCTGRSIDLTPSLFEAVGGDLSAGRIPGIDWWLN